MGAFLHRINKAYSLRVREATKTLHHTDLTAVAKTQTFNFAAALPAHAIVIGSHIDITEAVNDGAAGTFTADFGFAGTVNAWLDGVDLTTGIADKDNPKGATACGVFLGAVTPMITVGGSVNLSTATAGNFVASLLYIDPTQAD